MAGPCQRNEDRAISNDDGTTKRVNGRHGHADARPPVCVGGAVRNVKWHSPHRLATRTPAPSKRGLGHAGGDAIHPCPVRTCLKKILGAQGVVPERAPALQLPGNDHGEAGASDPAPGRRPSRVATRHGRFRSHRGVCQCAPQARGPNESRRSGQLPQANRAQELPCKQRQRGGSTEGAMRSRPQRKQPPTQRSRARWARGTSFRGVWSPLRAEPGQRAEPGARPDAENDVGSRVWSLTAGHWSCPSPGLSPLVAVMVRRCGRTCRAPCGALASAVPLVGEKLGRGAAAGLCEPSPVTPSPARAWALPLRLLLPETTVRCVCYYAPGLFCRFAAPRSTLSASMRRTTG